MKINKLKITAETAKKFGLKEIDLTTKSFGSIVALAGKNGAGKSRILNIVSNIFDYLDGQMIMERHLSNIPGEYYDLYYRLFQSNSYTTVQQYNSMLASKDKMLKNDYKRASDFLENCRNGLAKYIVQINPKEIINFESNLTEEINFESTFLTRTKPIDSAFFTSLLDPKSFEYLSRQADSALREEVSLYTRYRRDIDKVQTSLEANESFRKLTTLRKYVKLFLGNEFSYESAPFDESTRLSAYLTYNENVIKIKELSPGERTLMSFAMLFFILETNTNIPLKDCVIIIDEPETHLHPSAQIAVIDALKTLIEDSGQLWIATHSIHILSHLFHDEIFLVKENEIIAPSRHTPEKSLTDLMGIAENVTRMKQFISDMSDWAFANFMAQCLTQPDVVFDTNPKDKQYLLFKEKLTKDNISILDFGAGKGRLGYIISEDDEYARKITYSALEINREHHEKLREIKNIKHVAGSIDEINDEFDIVILCNVLHEIEPEYWCDIMVSIKRVLKTDGALWIIEDKKLPKGEKAHKYGYLLLDERELAMVFGQNESMTSGFSPTVKPNRFTFYSISKEDIKINPKNIIRALRELNNKSLDRIALIRAEANDIDSGRTMANSSQLHVNSAMAIAGLSKFYFWADDLWGHWLCIWPEGREIANITPKGKYLVNNEREAFHIEEILVNPTEGKIKFTKLSTSSPRDHRKNELKIASFDRLVGYENGKPICYIRIENLETLLDISE